MYAPNVLDNANAAVYKFSANNTDPKAAMIATYNFYMGQVRNGGLYFVFSVQSLTPALD